MKKMPKVLYVQWLDHFSSYAGWTPLELVEKSNPIPICHTSGFLLKETDEVLTLALNFSVDGGDSDYIECSNVMTILKSCIIKRRILKLKDA